MTKQQRFEKIIQYFDTHHPHAETELQYDNPYQLLVAVILSAQCTDKRVNMTTPAFYNLFPDAQSLAKATVDEVYQVIKSISYPNNKAKNLVAMAKMLTTTFHNIVPSEIAELERLPGVGRKTANVIASVVYNKPAMAVDTHVFRVAARLGLTYRARTPLATEQQLVKHIPENKIAIAHHWLILHGRYVCTARNPRCNVCEISAYCKYFERLNVKKK